MVRIQRVLGYMGESTGTTELYKCSVISSHGSTCFIFNIRLHIAHQCTENVQSFDVVR